MRFNLSLCALSLIGGGVNASSGDLTLLNAIIEKANAFVLDSYVMDPRSVKEVGAKVTNNLYRALRDFDRVDPYVVEKLSAHLDVHDDKLRFEAVLDDIIAVKTLVAETEITVDEAIQIVLAENEKEDEVIFKKKPEGETVDEIDATAEITLEPIVDERSEVAFVEAEAEPVEKESIKRIRLTIEERIEIALNTIELVYSDILNILNSEAEKVLIRRLAFKKLDPRFFEMQLDAKKPSDTLFLSKLDMESPMMARRLAVKKPVLKRSLFLSPFYLNSPYSPAKVSMMMRQLAGKTATRKLGGGWVVRDRTTAM